MEFKPDYDLFMSCVGNIDTLNQKLNTYPRRHWNGHERDCAL